MDTTIISDSDDDRSGDGTDNARTPPPTRAGGCAHAARTSPPIPPRVIAGWEGERMAAAVSAFEAAVLDPDGVGSNPAVGKMVKLTISLLKDAVKAGQKPTFVGMKRALTNIGEDLVSRAKSLQGKGGRVFRP